MRLVFCIRLDCYIRLGCSCMGQSADTPVWVQDMIWYIRLPEVPCNHRSICFANLFWTYVFLQVMIPSQETGHLPVRRKFCSHWHPQSAQTSPVSFRSGLTRTAPWIHWVTCTHIHHRLSWIQTFHLLADCTPSMIDTPCTTLVLPSSEKKAKLSSLPPKCKRPSSGQCGSRHISPVNALNSTDLPPSFGPTIKLKVCLWGISTAFVFLGSGGGALAIAPCDSYNRCYLNHCLSHI